MQDAARLVTNLQTESDGVDLVTLLRETPREAYSFQQLGVSGLIGAPDDSRTLFDRLNQSFIHSFSIQPRSIPSSPTLDPYAEPTFLTVDPHPPPTTIHPSIAVARRDRGDAHERAPARRLGALLHPPVRVLLRRPPVHQPRVGHRGQRALPLAP